MNQLAMLPVGEQALAGLPAAAGIPGEARGAPPDAAAFSLMLGEHLWTLSRPGGTGGDETAEGALPVAGQGEADANPLKLLRGLLAEAVNLAVDNAGGAEQLAGQLLSRIREALAGLAEIPGDGAGTGESTEQAGSASLAVNGEGASISLPPGLSRLLNQARPEPSGNLESVAAGEAVEHADRPVPHESKQQPANPALLMPLLRQVLQEFFSELRAAAPELELQPVSSGPALPPPVLAAGSAPDKAQPSPEIPDPIQLFAESDRPVGSPGGLENTSGQSIDNTVTLRSAAQPGQSGSSPLLATDKAVLSPSARWFNSQAGPQLPQPQAIPAMLQGPAPTAQPAVQPAQPGAAAARQPVTVTSQTLELPDGQSLQLRLRAETANALDPTSRFTLSLADPDNPEGELEIGMELSSRGPDRLFTAAEMQRVSAALQQVLSGDGIAQAAAAPGRSTTRMEASPAPARSVAIPEADLATEGVDAPDTVQTAGPTRSTAPAHSGQEGNEGDDSPRGAAVPETDKAEVQPAAAPAASERASLLSSVLSRRGSHERGNAAPGQDLPGSVSQPRERVLHPVENGSLSLQPQLSAHPQAADSVPGRLLQFSAPQVGTGISGYALDELRQQLLDKVSEFRNAGDGLYNMKLDLYPKELGRMVVNLAVRGDNVALQVAVLSRGQRSELQRSLDALKDSLEEDGLNVVDLRVLDIGEPAGGNRNASQEGRS
ncbi:MAG: flagellar hook-length control protein FliK [bacterium]